MQKLRNFFGAVGNVFSSLAVGYFRFLYGDAFDEKERKGENSG